MDMASIVEGIRASREARSERREGVTEETEQLRRELQGRIKEFREDRAQARSQLQDGLFSSREGRRSEVQEIRQGAQNLMQDFRGARQRAASQLRDSLAKGLTDRRSNIRQGLEEARVSLSDFRSVREEVRGQLRKALAELRDNLAQSNTSRIFEAKELIQAFRRARIEVRSEMQKTEEAWRNRSRTMGVPEPAKPEHKTQEAGTTPEAPEEKESAEEVEDEADWEQRILSAAQEHPEEGISLSEVAEIYGVSSVAFARAAKILIDQGKIRKEDNRYFPA